MCRPGGRLMYRPPVAKTPKQEQFACPLVGVEAHAVIEDFVASVTLVQAFKNVEENPIEAVYQFPLDEKYCICSFTAEIDGKVIVGQCKEKEEAKDIYDDAVASGHGAYLLEQDDAENTFKVNVGNLPPGKEVKISLTYVAELVFNADGVLQWTLASNKVKEGSAGNPYFRAQQASLPMPTLKLDVKLDMTSNIKSLSSPSHPISFEFGDEPSQATVNLSNEGALEDKDFLLSVKLAKPHQPCARVLKDEQGNVAAMAALYPEITLGEDEEIYTEMIFVVDRSGSMSGSRINQVRDTMQIFLRSLGEGTMLNIVGFGPRAEFLFSGGSVEYNDKNLDLATKHVTDLKANLGGTNILTPLQQILSSKPIEGYPRQLFILTDGEVSNTQECIDYVRKNSHTTRVFTFGIGGEASPQLVQGMAKAGEGYSEFILAGENMEVKVLRQLKRAMQPAFTDIKVEWAGDKVQPAPYRLPPLFMGGRLIVYAMLPSDTKESEVKVTAKTAIKPFEAVVKFNAEQAKAGRLFHQLGSKQLIRDLEEGRSYMHDDNGNLVGGKSAEDVKQEMIKLSTKYGVLCKHTAFVAVEEREEATEGSMQRRQVSSGPSVPIPPPVNKVPARNIAAPAIRKPGSSGEKKDKCASRASPSPQKLSSASAPQKKGGLSLFRRGSASSSASAPAPAPVLQSSERKSRHAAEGGRRDQDRSKEKEKLHAPMREEKERKNSISEDKKKKSKSKSSKDIQSFKKKEKVYKDADECISPSPVSSSLAPPPVHKKESEASSEDESEGEAEKKEEQIEAASQEMRNIIMKQKASGSWASSDVASLLGGKFGGDAVKNATPASSGSAGDIAAVDIWATAVVVAFLQQKWPRQKPNWELVVQKAKRWLTKQLKALGVADADWEAQAGKFVGVHL